MQRMIVTLDPAQVSNQQETGGRPVEIARAQGAMPDPCRRLLAALLGVVAWSAVLAATPAVAAPGPAAQAEIEHLLAHLGRSGCEFFRNGKWFAAPKARDHLRKKFDYLLEKDLIDTAEHFIERAATESSRSGEAYQVRCPGAAETPSARWLAEELARYRARGAK